MILKFFRTHRLTSRMTATSLCGLLTLIATHSMASEASDFSRLVELSASRLEISQRVALTKWDSKMPVADPPNDPREKQVVDAAAEEAKKLGLSTDLATAFFSDQIEASKLIQFSLMFNWIRNGGAPTTQRSDLKTELRPALDRLRTQFLEELVATRSLREDRNCKAKLVAASTAHVHRQRLTPLYAVALDRGLARVCGD